MKKYVSLFLTLCMLLTMIPLAAMMVSAEGESTATGAITPDTSWCDDHKEDKDLYIYDAADLLGFSKLLSTQVCANNENSEIAKVDDSMKLFLGKTVHIMADIDLNPGWTLNKNDPKAPTNVWLNQPYHCFTGMIDGHGHTISGIYYDAKGGNHNGIFGSLKGTSENVVGAKNLAIVNSYIATNTNNSGGLFGSIPNDIGGTVALIENVYLDVLTVSYYTAAENNLNYGGVIGFISVGTTLTIRNTIVNSTVKLNDKSKWIRPVGGMIGRLNGTAKIEDTLFTGMVSSGGNQIGAFVGLVEGRGSLTINHCLEAGDVDPALGCADYNGHGSMLGISWNANNTISNSIYTDTYWYPSEKKTKGSNLYGETNSTKLKVNENNIYVPDDEVYGLGMAEKLTTAGMTNWTVTTTGCPMPRSMVIMFPWLVEKDDAAKTPVTKLAGYQVSDATDGKMNLRLVATLKFPEGKGLNDYTAVGFRVVANYGNVTKYTNISTNEVYSGVAGYTKGSTTVTEYTATSLGGDYVFVLPCQGVPADQTITMEVTTYYVTAEGETLGATVAFTVNASGTALPQ